MFLNKKNKIPPNGYSPKLRKKDGEKISDIKIIIIIIPIIMIIVITMGIWLSVKEYNKIIEVGNIATKDEYIDSKQLILSNEEQEKLLTFVTPDQKLTENYNVTLEKFNGIYCDMLIIEPLKEMISAAKNEGVNLILTKGYVSPREQDQLYNDKVQELLESKNLTIVKAEAEAKKIVPPGNYSEYQTGLSVEINTSDGLSKDEFMNTGAYAWLNRNSVDFGFVIRYPEAKEAETGISFDPTYYRYVGIENAKKMRAMDMCLDEYYEYINER